MIFTSTIGLEEVQRAALIRLFQFTNEAIAEREAFKVEEDQALADFLGRPYVPVEIEQIKPENFYEGHRPSLINAPVESYPNIAVWGVRGTVHPESALSDHTDIFNIRLFVEIMCKSLDSEDTVNKRTVRTAEAVNAVMSIDKSLGNAVTGFEEVQPMISDVFTRKERTTYGDRWFWQGARIEYVIRKDAIRSGPDADATQRFFQNLPEGMSPEEWAALDQS